MPRRAFMEGHMGCQWGSRTSERPKLSTKSDRRAGFTIVEVLITLLIAGTLVLIAAFSYQRAARRLVLQNEAIALASRLEQASAQAQTQVQASAQLQGTEFRMRFIPASSSYIVE